MSLNISIVIYLIVGQGMHNIKEEILLNYPEPRLPKDMKAEFKKKHIE